jgi:hypothetical protein
MTWMSLHTRRAAAPAGLGVAAFAALTLVLPAPATAGPAHDQLLAASTGPAARATSAATAERRRRAAFDLEGHRGTRGLRPEDTLPAFAKALDIGVRTLELDTGITKDGVVIVSHERMIAPLVCTDTAPVHAR